MGNKLKYFIQNLITSGVPGNFDSENIRKIVLINIYSSVGIFFMISIGAIDLLQGKLLLGFTLLAFAVVFLFFFFFLRKTKNPVIPGNMIVTLMFLLAVFLLFNGGSSKSGYVWYFVLPLTALFILGKKRGLVFIIISLLLALVILYLLPALIYFQKYVCEYPADIKFRVVASYFAVSILSYIFEYSRDLSYSRQIEANEKVEQLLQESLAQQSLIQIQNKDLEKANRDLEKLSIVASETENAVAIASVEGIIEWVNTGFTKLYGYTYDEFIKERGANIIKTSTNTEILETIIDCLGSRQPVVYTSSNTTKAGKKIWVQTTLTPVHDANGTISKLIIIDSDITKIMKAEEEIKQQNEEIKQQNEEIKSQRDQLEDINKELDKLSIVARETDNSVIIANKDGSIEWVNEGFRKLWGYSLSEYKAIRGDNILIHNNNKLVTDLIEDCLENKRSVVFVIPASSKYNPSIWIQTTLTPILDAVGKVSRLVAIEVEITDIKEAEDEIKQQNEEIKQQNEEISTQRDNLNSANLDLIETNEILTDSIQYAKLIQTSILPKEIEIKKYNPDSFIYFKPKSIVSGDFYWFYGLADKYIVAVADCTGHGVPGAFMSMIGNTLLNRIIKEEKIYDPALILERLNAGIINSLNQGSEYTDIQDDGMDVSICYVDNTEKQITIACANQMAFIAQKDKLTVIKGSIYSIGGLISYKSHPQYCNQTFSIEPGSAIYLFSDGFQDQFGGKKYNKFGMAQFEKLIVSILHMPMNEQGEALATTHETWKGTKNQTDDILVLGIRFP